MKPLPKEKKINVSGFNDGIILPAPQQIFHLISVRENPGRDR
jgi:hypothetical protein